MNRPREFWIEEDDNGLLEVCRYKPPGIYRTFHVIDINAYQSLQEKYDKLQQRLSEAESILKKIANDPAYYCSLGTHEARAFLERA